ncbi:MAG: dihydrodipicolinate reductase C-terminal domain-containing protein [Paludibacter sp.]|nr:dihydrodipicolinate reductase C-terminal domain-containing protein [Paludibacter sp.]
MKIGLVGFGNTGKAVASVLLKHENFELKWVLRKSSKQENRYVSDILEIDSDNRACVFSLHNNKIEQLLDEHPVDIIIDFSSEKGIYSYGKAAAERQIKIISAVSHYEEREVAYLKKLGKISTVFWSPNITLGVNYLIFAAKVLKSIAPFVDIEIVEEHFKQKHGVSGTAIKIAESLGMKKTKINSVRAGGIVGKHQVIFGFKYQTIRLIHESISREAFGNGAVFVAENLINKEKGFYQYEDIFKPYLTNKI